MRWSSPSRSMTPGRKLWRRTSARRTRSFTSARSAGSLRSATTASLLRFIAWKEAVSPSIQRPAKARVRPISPVTGRSTLITRAPRSASRRAATGPARNWLKSSTTVPCSGRSSRSSTTLPASVRRPSDAQHSTAGASARATSSLAAPAAGFLTLVARDPPSKATSGEPASRNRRDVRGRARSAPRGSRSRRGRRAGRGTGPRRTPPGRGRRRRTRRPWRGARGRRRG